MNKALYFKSPGCAVCENLLPKIQTCFETEYPNLNFEIIEVNREPELAAQNQVFSAPTLLIFLDGKEFYRFSRNFSPYEIHQKLKRVYDLKFE